MWIEPFFPGGGDTIPNVTGLSALSYPDDFLGVLCPNVWSPVGWMVDWAVPRVWWTTLMVSSNSPNGIKLTTDHKKTQRGATELAQLVSNLNFMEGWQWWRWSIYSWMIEQPNLHERASRHDLRWGHGQPFSELKPSSQLYQARTCKD